VGRNGCGTGFVSLSGMRIQDKHPTSRHRSVPVCAFGRVLLVLFLTAFVQTTPAAAQMPGWTGDYGSILDDPDTAAQGERALRYIYDMRPADAVAVIDSLKARYPGHPMGPFLDGLVIWWEILPVISVGDTSLDDDFFRAMERTVKAADRIDDKYALDGVFFKAAAIGFRGRHLSNRREWLKAARDGKTALDLVFNLAERDPDNPDFQFGVGVYNYFASAIPREYPVVKPVMYFFPKADPAAGIATLERVSQDASFVGTEAAYFLLQIYLGFEPDYDNALRVVTMLRERHPANAFFHVLEGRVYSRWGRFSSAAETYQDAIGLFQEGAPGYSSGVAQNALYNLARSRMAAGDLDQALVEFDQLEEVASTDERSVFRAMGRLRAGMALDRLGRRPEAELAYRKVLDLPKVSDSHDLAKRYLKSPFGS
jgi:tetratricopeptide (TPR) repeat protein